MDQTAITCLWKGGRSHGNVSGYRRLPVSESRKIALLRKLRHPCAGSLVAGSLRSTIAAHKESQHGDIAEQRPPPGNSCNDSRITAKRNQRQRTRGFFTGRGT